MRHGLGDGAGAKERMLRQKRPLRGGLILGFWFDFPTLFAPLPVQRMQVWRGLRFTRLPGVCGLRIILGTAEKPPPFGAIW
jgi:hypothetical protein